MIIVCNSCSAQYSVNDAKVRGKLVRITCKHCATAIVVDGRNMSDAEVASHKPMASYPLPRRDESIVAAMPQSLAPGRDRSPASAPKNSPAATPAWAPLPSAMREEDQTMVTRSRFGDDTSVHDERTVIGQIPKEALEFERMFAQRTQPPPPDAPSKPTTASAPAPAAPVPGSPPLPSFASEPPASADLPESPSASDAPAAADAPAASEDPDDETENIPHEGFSQSEPPTVGNQPTSDTRGLVTMAEVTHPSVARAVTARRLRVTLITVLVLAVLVALFVIRMPR